MDYTIYLKKKRKSVQNVLNLNIIFSNWLKGLYASI